jgi:sialidase-1
MDLDRSDECMAAETTGGGLYMDMRSRRGARCRAHAWSHDGGRTWSAVAHDEGLPEPSCQGSIVRLDGQRVLMAHPAATDRSERLTLLVCADECQTWPWQRVLDKGYAGYSDLAIARDGTVLCLYETEPCRALTLARIEPAWLNNHAS